MTKEFYSHGKLLISGEYGVLDGALSLALPTKFGQSLRVEETHTQQLQWKSLDENAAVWFEGSFDIPNAKIITSTATDTAEVLLKILLAAKQLNINFLNGSSGYYVKTQLDFPRNWGLGSSSTLIHNIALWANVDAYKLLWNSFSGSGYDIACAQHDRPILYQLNDQMPMVQEAAFHPPFKDAIYFIYLNKKQNSREGITAYRKSAFDKEKFISALTTITKQIISCTEVQGFKDLLVAHEKVIAQILNLKPIKDVLFQDYEGAIKSLGAWGGDFIMAVGSKDTPNYFKKKGYPTILTYAEMVLE